MDLDLLLKALNASKKGQSYAFATVVESTEKGTPRKPGAKMLVLEDGSLFGTIGGGRDEKVTQETCLKAIKNGKTDILTFEHFGKKNQSICGGKTKVFIEPFKGVRRLIICGGGHIGLHLSVIAKMLNFEVIVLDNRKEFATKSRFPHVDRVVFGEFGDNIARFGNTKNCYIMIATFGHDYDYVCLKNALRTQASYIGLISSRNKRNRFFKELKKEGFSNKELKRIVSPAGLDIGAQTPEEIAVSISAEIVKLYNSDLVGSYKFKEKNNLLFIRGIERSKK